MPHKKDNIGLLLANIRDALRDIDPPNEDSHGDSNEDNHPLDFLQEGQKDNEAYKNLSIHQRFNLVADGLNELIEQYSQSEKFYKWLDRLVRFSLILGLVVLLAGYLIDPSAAWIRKGSMIEFFIAGCDYFVTNLREKAQRFREQIAHFEGKLKLLANFINTKKRLSRSLVEKAEIDKFLSGFEQDCLTSMEKLKPSKPVVMFCSSKNNNNINNFKEIGNQHSRHHTHVEANLADLIKKMQQESLILSKSKNKEEDPISLQMSNKNSGSHHNNPVLVETMTMIRLGTPTHSNVEPSLQMIQTPHLLQKQNTKFFPKKIQQQQQPPKALINAAAAMKKVNTQHTQPNLSVSITAASIVASEQQQPILPAPQTNDSPPSDQKSTEKPVVVKDDLSLQQTPNLLQKQNTKQQQPPKALINAAASQHPVSPLPLIDDSPPVEKLADKPIVVVVEAPKPPVKLSAKEQRRRNKMGSN